MTVPVVARPKARSLIVAPRLPERPKQHSGNPFTSDGDIVADCNTLLPDGSRCGYHCMGPRDEVKKALDLHHKLYHPESIGMVLLNQPRQ
jgi:hypothetical protein